jgi:hypothetical protein
MRRRMTGQAAAEFALCVAILALAVFAPALDGTSVATYLARQMVAWFHGLHSLLAYS